MVIGKQVLIGHDKLTRRAFWRAGNAYKNLPQGFTWVEFMKLYPLEKGRPKLP